MFIEISLLVVFLICWHEYQTKYSRIGKYMSKVPGPPVWPFLGNIPHFIQGQYPTQETIWKAIRRLDVTFYPIFKLCDTHRVCAVILHPDDVEKLLTSMKHTQKSFLYNALHGWLGTGLLTSHGAKWQTRRKMLTPAFHFNVLQQYFKSIVENGEKTMEALLSKGEAVYDVDELVSDYTLKVICETAMGVKLTEGNINEYREAIHCIGSSAVYRTLYPWFGPEFIFGMTKRGREYKRALNTLHSFTKKIIQERKELHDKTDDGYFLKGCSSAGSNNISTDDVYCGYRKKRMAMLDLLIAAQRDNGQIDDQGIQEEVDTFLFEGHDTSAVALMFAILLIAEHEDVQNRIRVEVSEILDRTNGELEMSAVQNCHYLEMCLKECLRLHPSVPYLSRYTAEDLQLTDYLIPKGTLIEVHPYSIHRIPEFWPDPEKFDPERFSPENSKKRHPFSYIPFSAGSRNCIGQKFAMLELKSFMAYLINNFYLKPVSATKDIAFITDIIHRPSQPTYVKLVPIRN